VKSNLATTFSPKWIGHTGSDAAKGRFIGKRFFLTLSTKLRISVSNEAKPADFMGSFPSGFQRIVFVFWGFRGSSINESQIKILPMKTEGQGMTTAHILQIINTLSGLTF
jgi:hypothetical protein